MYNINDFIELINSDLSDEEVVNEIFKLIPTSVQRIYSNFPNLSEPLANYEGMIGEDDAITTFYGTFITDEKTYVGKLHFDIPNIYPLFIKYTRKFLKKALLQVNNNLQEDLFMLITNFMDYYFQKGDTIELRKKNAITWNSNRQTMLEYKNQVEEYERRISTDDALKQYRDLYAISISQKEIGNYVIANYPLSAFIGLDGENYRIGQCTEHNLFAHNLAYLIGLNPILISGRYRGEGHTFSIIPNNDSYIVFDPFNKTFGGECTMKGKNHYDGFTIAVTHDGNICKYETSPRKLVFERDSTKTK